MPRTTGEETPITYDAGAPETPLRSDLDGSPFDVGDADPADFTSIKPTVSKLYIPEMGKNVYVRMLDGRERDAYEASIITGKGQNKDVNMRGARARLAALCLAYPDGRRMFADDQVKDLNAMPAPVLERIFDRARKFNALTGEDTDAAEGNSDADRSGASTSG